MKTLMWVVTISFVGVLCGAALFGQRATLVALESLQISQTIDGQSNIALIAPESRLAVVRCVDTKSLIIPEVELPNQKTGYAVFGKFKMEYASAFSFTTPAPISYSCP
jgi:hypothetical protein